MDRIKPTKIIIYVGPRMSVFEQAKPQLIASFARNKADKIEIAYKHSPEDTENLNAFITSIRTEHNPRAIVFDQLYWQANTTPFFEGSELEDVKALYVENYGSLSRLLEDGSFIVIPTTSLHDIVNH